MKYSKTPNLAGDFPYFDAARLPGPVCFFTPVRFSHPPVFSFTVFHIHSAKLSRVICNKKVD